MEYTASRYFGYFSNRAIVSTKAISLVYDRKMSRLTYLIAITDTTMQ